MRRAFAKDASLGERATALAVSVAMKAKRSITKIGKGIGGVRQRSDINRILSNEKISTVKFDKLVRDAKLAIKESKPDSIRRAVKVALKSVRKGVKGKKVKKPRVIKIPTFTGGVLPLIPIFAGLSALGAVVGSTASVINAINSAKSAQKELEENKRHNTTMEAIAIGKGYYLQPNKRKNGNGYYLKQNSKNF